MNGPLNFQFPLSFVLFRIIHYYMETGEIRSCVKEWNLYGEMGISQEEVEVYQQMEKHFQEYILGSHVPMREMYGKISPGVMNVYRMAKKEQENAAAARTAGVFTLRRESFGRKIPFTIPWRKGRYASACLYRSVSAGSGWTPVPAPAC